MSGDWKVDARRLWGAGLVTAVAAALTGAVCWFFIGDLFNANLQVSRGAPNEGNVEEMTIWSAVVISFLVAVAATGLLHLLLVQVPNGERFFRWIALLILLVSLIPVFQMPGMTTADKLWQSLLHLAVYSAIVPTLSALVPRVATRVR